MDFSFKEFFLTKVFGQEKSLDTIDQVIEKAEKIAKDVTGEMKYIQKKWIEHSNRELDPIIDQTGFAVENAQGYIYDIEDKVRMLADNLRPHAENLRDDDIYQRLKSVSDTFENAQHLFVDFINDVAPDRSVEKKDVQIGYFSNLVKMIEPDKRPRAPVIPIREGMGFDQ